MKKKDMGSSILFIGTLVSLFTTSCDKIVSGKSRRSAGTTTQQTAATQISELKLPASTNALPEEVKSNAKITAIHELKNQQNSAERGLTSRLSYDGAYDRFISFIGSRDSDSYRLVLSLTCLSAWFVCSKSLSLRY